MPLPRLVPLAAAALASLAAPWAAAQAPAAAAARPDFLVRRPPIAATVDPRALAERDCETADRAVAAGNRTLATQLLDGALARCEQAGDAVCSDRVRVAQTELAGGAGQRGACEALGRRLRDAGHVAGVQAASRCVARARNFVPAAAAAAPPLVPLPPPPATAASSAAARTRARLLDEVAALDRRPPATASPTDALERLRAGRLKEALGDPLAAARTYEAVAAATTGGASARALTELGELRRAAGQLDQAQGALELARSRAAAAQDYGAEAAALDALGRTLHARGQDAAAEQRLNDAVLRYRRVGDRGGQGSAITSLAEVDLAQARQASAVGRLKEALPLHRQAAAPLGEARALSDLAAAVEGRAPTAAAYLSKKAVLVHQRARLASGGVSPEEQRSRREATGLYRGAVERFLGLGRLAEGHAMLSALRGLEVEQVVGATVAADPAAAAPSFTPPEAAAEGSYESAQADYQRGAADYDAKCVGKPLSPGAAKACAQLARRRDEARSRLDAWVDAMQKDLSCACGADVREQRALAASLDEGTVAVFTFVGRKNLWVFVVARGFEQAYPVKISPDDLAAKVTAAREALMNPAKDPRPAMGALYDVLLRPIAPDLELLKAETLAWWLDGPLKGVPMAALWDGARWVVERYETATFTLASESRLALEPRAAWTALALGTSQAHAGFSALPGVARELELVVKATADEPGVLSGTRLLDAAFTRDALVAGLAASPRPAVVHLATHYVLAATLEGPSSLLLGDGQLLPLVAVDSDPGLQFDGVDLVTLSACDTRLGKAPEGVPPGAEVDGLAAVIQQRGARAVLATLWRVSDASAPDLMRTFYAFKSAETHPTKASALRSAQLLLLGGMSTPQDAKERGVGDADAPAGTTWSHPFYWAPFVLVGNWR